MRNIIRSAAFAACLLAGVAQAGVIDWQFSYAGSGITATGELVTTSTLDSHGAYEIIGISGTRTDTSGTKLIDSLLPTNPSYNDNLLFMSGGYFDQLGVGFLIGTTKYDFYFNSMTGCGALGYREDAGSAFPYCSFNAPSIRSVSVTRSVPEPGAMSLLALGVGLVLLGGFASRRRPAQAAA